MVALFAILGWLAFSTLAAVVARVVAVKFAERRGYSALTMPMSYHVTFIIIYLVLVYSSFMVVHFTWLV
jgi:hypothetical protein